MPDLAAQLQAFAAALSAPSLAAADLSLLAGDAERARRRFGLYRGNVQANAVRALRHAYPVILALVGDAFFDALACAYAAARPSTSGNVDEAGAAFAAFLDGFPHADDLPYLPDVARLEWLAHAAHFAADAPALDVAKLAALPPERLGDARLRLHPACAVLASAWPVGTIWQVHQASHDGPLEVDLDRPECVLVLRPAWRVSVETLSAAAHDFLSACRDGATFSAALDAARARDPHFDLGRHLAAWIARGALADLDA